MLVAVLNTDENIIDVLKEEFPGCDIDTSNDAFIMDGVVYDYYREDVKRMPIDDISIYVVERT